MPQVEVIVKGHIDAEWGDWFEGLEFQYRDDGTTMLHGEVTDQAALYGILARLRDLGLELISVGSSGESEETA
jgi:hypothetical protein